MPFLAASRLGQEGFVLEGSHPDGARILLLYVIYLDKFRGEKPNSISSLKARPVEMQTAMCV